ncbi:hypothetical protein BGZ68_005949 [Mortierella alpina]|nr:hypothetical protein BGZ68_005949 [Mortierella alpina]
MPVEISNNIFMYLECMDLVRCRAVCRPWRSMIRSNTRLWRSKMRHWNVAECFLLKEYQEERRAALISKSQDPQSPREGPSFDEEQESILDKIESRPDFLGWESALVQELALNQNWRWGRSVHDMTVTLSRNIKPALLAWPLLILVDDWPRVYKVSLDRVRKDAQKVIVVNNDRHTEAMDLQGHGAVRCIAWDTSSTCATTEDGNVQLPLALGGFTRSVRLCDLETRTTTTLPDVQHGFPLHLCFVRNHILSITLDGQMTFFQKDKDHRPVRSCTVDTKVLQVAVVDFGSRSFERDGDSGIITWREAICLAHEGGVFIKDEHSQTMCHIQLEMGAQLLQFQAIADNTPPYRNELLILFEHPNLRQRRVLRVKMNPGYRQEQCREMLSSSVSLGRGGDARDSIAMYRDRIGIVSHRSCSSDLGHYCVLRWVDLKEDVAMSTEYTQQESEEGPQGSADGVGDSDVEEDACRDGQTWIQKRGKAIHLNDFAGHTGACRILAMDHARIVLGMGPRIVKILCMV